MQAGFTVYAMATLSERIKEAIESSGVSVADVATACGITPQAVYDWMSGNTKELMGENLVELAEITGFDARWIAKDSGPKKRVYARTAQQAHVLQVMQAMNSYEAALLVKITDTIPPKSAPRENQNDKPPAS